MKQTAKSLAEAVGAKLEGDGAVELRGVAAPESGSWGPVRDSWPLEVAVGRYFARAFLGLSETPQTSIKST